MRSVRIRVRKLARHSIWTSDFQLVVPIPPDLFNIQIGCIILKEPKPDLEAAKKLENERDEKRKKELAAREERKTKAKDEKKDEKPSVKKEEKKDEKI